MNGPINVLPLKKVFLFVLFVLSCSDIPEGGDLSCVLDTFGKPSMSKGAML